MKKSEAGVRALLAFFSRATLQVVAVAPAGGCTTGAVRNAAAREQALDLAIRAFDLGPSQAAMREIVLAARFPELVPQVNAFCESYFHQFGKNGDTWRREHGYYHRILSALIVCAHLRQAAKENGDEETMRFYEDRRDLYGQEQELLIKSKRW